jgi:hypothetical protein
MIIEVHEDLAGSRIRMVKEVSKRKLNGQQLIQMEMSSL